MTPTALVVFDLDGALIRGPTVCEVLAQSLGHADQMKRIGAYTDEADISASRAEMSRWYSSVDRTWLAACLKDARLAPGVREGVKRLREAGVAVGIASTTWLFAAEWFAAKLGVDHVLGSALSEAGEIDHVWPRHKADWFLALAERLAIPIKRTAAVGATEGDLPMLAASGCGVYVGLARPPGLAGAHMPAADIRDVASHVLAAWQSA